MASPIFRNTLLTGAAWTLIIAASFTWQYQQVKEQTQALAVNTARGNFDKDQAYRFWASKHGGVYVKPDERTPPNPYLAHLPDRDVETTDGQSLTLMNPAYMLRQMMQEFGEWYGIKGRIVGKVALNPNNIADPWEAAAIDAFEKGVPEKMERIENDGASVLRLMKPMVMEESCMKCHGHLGFKPGEIRGGVGVAVPMAPYLALEGQAVENNIMIHGSLWLLGILSIGWIGRRSQARFVERKAVMNKLQLSDRVFKNTSEAIIITAPNGDILDVNDAFAVITGYNRDEVIGQNPRIMKSTRQDDDFYRAMWERIEEDGSWSGEIWDRRKNGEEYPKWLTINAVKNAEGEITHHIGVFSDITKTKAVEHQLHQMAYFDALTGLPNRALFRDRLERQIISSGRRDKKTAILFIDLDRFKYVNDLLGHTQGDRLLIEAAHRLSSCVRDMDTVARQGGDEFTLILSDMDNVVDVVRVIQCILEQFTRPFSLEGGDMEIGASIGVSLFPDHGRDVETLTKNADAAMYEAKSSGGQSFHFFADRMTDFMARRIKLEQDLRAAVEAEALTLHYQPKMAIRSGEMIGMEALLRWDHPELGMIPPTEFIPIAEDAGLIIPLGEWVLRQACQQNVQWRSYDGPLLKVAVNLSARQFEQRDLVERIADILEETGLPPEALELEITEGMVMKDPEQAIVALNRLRDLGVSLAVDDFGTGYSSLSYLQRFPLQSLKIDKSFVQDAQGGPEGGAIVSAIISLANRLEMTVVAEGVETREQLEFLRKDGCDEIQGYYYSRPLTVQAFGERLATLTALNKTPPDRQFREPDDRNNLDEGRWKVAAS